MDRCVLPGVAGCGGWCLSIPSLGRAEQREGSGLGHALPAETSILVVKYRWLGHVCLTQHYSERRRLVMNSVSRSAHWENVYATKGENEVSWFQENPTPSLELMDLAQLTPDSAIIDIGSGASRLVDRLVARGFRNLTVLDLSESARSASKARLADQANNVPWRVAGVTTW